MDVESIQTVTFRYRAKFGHFLRAEASVSALTYPVPPRTALIGLIGAILGMPKDTPQVALAGSRIAVDGAVPGTHWHKVKLRKDPPAPLALSVKKGAKGSSAPEKATLIKQEWLFEPDYEVIASLPDEYHREFVERLRERRWHYTPCMGLSEMLADLELVSESTATSIAAASEVECRCVVRSLNAKINGRRSIEAGEPLAILSQRMPREVTAERVFTHEDYLVERSGLPIPVVADDAWRLDEDARAVIFL